MSATKYGKFIENIPDPGPKTHIDGRYDSGELKKYFELLEKVMVGPVKATATHTKQELRKLGFVGSYQIYRGKS